MRLEKPEPLLESGHDLAVTHKNRGEKWREGETAAAAAAQALKNKLELRHLRGREGGGRKGGRGPAGWLARSLGLLRCFHDRLFIRAPVAFTGRRGRL